MALDECGGLRVSELLRHGGERYLAVAVLLGDLELLPSWLLLMLFVRALFEDRGLVLDGLPVRSRRSLLEVALVYVVWPLRGPIEVLILRRLVGVLAAIAGSVRLAVVWLRRRASAPLLRGPAFRLGRRLGVCWAAAPIPEPLGGVLLAALDGMQAWCVGFGVHDLAAFERAHGASKLVLFVEGAGFVDLVEVDVDGKVFVGLFRLETEGGLRS